MKTEEFENKFGALTDGLRVKGWVAQRWNLLILVRWVITCVILITLREYNHMQIIVLYIVSVFFQFFIVSGRPNDSSLENKISFINEVFVSIYLYILMLLTDFMGENNFREQYGQALVGLVCSGVLTNLVKFFIQVIILLKKKIYYLKMLKAKIQLKEWAQRVKKI